MNSQNILRITLFVSVLAFNPAVAQTLSQRTLGALAVQKQNRLGAEIARDLEAKGLEADAAKTIGESFVQKCHTQTAAMAANIVHHNIATHEDVVAYLSDEALFRRSADLSDYDTLVRMATQIHQEKLSKEMLVKLQKVAQQNSMIAV